MAQAIMGVVSGIGGLFKSVKGAEGSKFKEFAKGVGGMAKEVAQSGIESILGLATKALAPLSDLLKPILKVVDLFASMLKVSLAPIIQKIFEKIFTPENIEKIQKMVDWFMKLLNMVMEPFQGLMERLQANERIQQAMQRLGQAIERLFSAIGDVVATFVESGLLESLIENVVAVTILVVEIVAGVIQELVDSGALQALIDLTILIVDIITWAINFLVDSGLIDVIVWIITVPITLLMEGLQWLADNFDNICQFFIDVGQWFVDAWNTIVAVFQAIGQFFVDIWTGIVTFFNWIVTGIQAIGQFFVDVWEAIVAGFQWFGELLADIWDGIVGAFEAFVNVFIGIINFIIDGLNGLDFLNWFADIPHVPYLQTGGIIDRSGIAVVHAGEQVINAETVGLIADLISSTAGAQPSPSARNYNTTVNTVTLDERQATILAREIARQNWLVER